MNRLPRALLSVVVGVVVFFCVTIAVTEGLAPYIWLSLMTGVPVGGVVGVAAVPLAFFGILVTCCHQRLARASAPPSTDLK